VLRHDDLGLSAIRGVRVVHVVAIDEHHDVGILLYRSAFTQVRQHRALVGPQLQLAGEL
jgi:hypothetical protein